MKCSKPPASLPSDLPYQQLRRIFQAQDSPDRQEASMPVQRQDLFGEKTVIEENRIELRLVEATPGEPLHAEFTAPRQDRTLFRLAFQKCCDIPQTSAVEEGVACVVPEYGGIVALGEGRAIRTRRDGLRPQEIVGMLVDGGDLP